MVKSIKCNSIHECILEVALEYSDKLHKIHNDYSLPPEKLKINHDMPSDYCSDIANKYDIKIGNVNKLVANVGNKSKYALHYKNLSLYLSLGIKLTKVHRILKFKQSNWFKIYIDCNTDKIKNTANNFKKDFFKLMNNSIYGKKRENLTKKISAKNYKKYVSKASFVLQKIFSENVVAIHETKPVLTLNEPVYVGFSTLDLSKYLMQDFYYNYIKRKHDAKLLLAGTNSLVYEIKTNDVYEDFYKN